MRFFKVFLLTFAILAIILTITYRARVLVSNHFITAQLSSIKVNITCLDISLTSNMNIMIDKLCLHTPKADIETTDTVIQWQNFPHLNITNIDIDKVNIKGITPLFTTTNHIVQTNSQQSIKQLLLTTLQPYTEKISQFKLPVKINIAEIFYLPFSVTNKGKALNKIAKSSRVAPYIATLSTIDNTLYFSLRNSEKIEFIKAKLSKNKSDFSIALSSKLTLLKNFITIHQLPITPKFQSLLNAHKISGHFNSTIEYHAGYLDLQNTFAEIEIDSDSKIGNNSEFKLLGTLNFSTRLKLSSNKKTNDTTTVKYSNKSNKSTDKSTVQHHDEITLTFNGKNEISLDYKQASLVKWLAINNFPIELSSLIKDNPLSQLTLKLPDDSTLVLNQAKTTHKALTKNTLSINAIEISAHSHDKIHQASFRDIVFTLPYSNNNTRKKTPYIFAINKFSIDSPLKLVSVTDLAKFTTAPVSFHLIGSVNKTAKQTTLHLTNNSSITVNNLMVYKAKNAKKPFFIKSLTSRLNGNIQLLKNNAIFLNVNVHSQTSAVNIPEILQVNAFELVSEIKGKLDNIKMNAIAKADGITLGHIIINGPVLSPKILVSANKLALTDLLSLNIQLPSKISLTEGTLNYNVSGQITDLSSIENTPFMINAALHSVSGTIKEIGWQNLNWQQRFKLHLGKITSVKNNDNNLTVQLINTSAPISNLAMKLNWTFNKHFRLYNTKLTANILGGSVKLANIQWPFQQNHSFKVQLNNIDLAKVVALNKKQGVIVTGYISGEIPVTFDGEKYSIENGELHNTTDGLIQVVNNPAVVNLKANNSELKFAFDALENLHYHQLSSAVSLADDGYMLLETVIKGHNPDIDNDVNLNFKLSYDLPGLLKSLSITENFENRLIKDLQKNKE